MDVNGYRMDPIKPGTPEPAHPVRERSDPPPRDAADRSSPEREDLVDISADGWRAAAEAAEAAEADVTDTAIPEGTLPAERLLDLRRQIQARVHDDPQVVDEMIQRMVDLGDL